MKLILKKGQTSQRIAVFIQDSSSATGAGLAGLVYNTANLKWYYWREDAGNAAGVAVTLATATLGTFASGGFKEKDATNMVGFYELGIPDAVLATGAKWAVMVLFGAANMAPVTVEIELIDADLFDGVRLGLTALPNAAAEAAGGLYTRGTGAGQIRQDTNGRIDTNTKAWIDGTIPAVNVTGVPKVDLIDWLGAAPDVLSSGKVAADLKLWLAAAPATTDISGVPKVQLAATSNVTYVIFGSTTTFIAGDSSSLSAVVSYYVGSSLRFINGVNRGMSRRITAYDGAGGITTDVWPVVPGIGDLFYIEDGSQVTVGDKTGFALSTAGTQAIWDKLTSALTTSGSIGKRLVDYLTGDIFARIGAPVGASISVDLAAVKSDTATMRSDIENTVVAGSVSDASPAVGDFDGNAGLSAIDDFYTGSVLVFTSGTLRGIARKITGYTGATKNLAFFSAFPAAPANADTFWILGRIN